MANIKSQIKRNRQNERRRRRNRADRSEMRSRAVAAIEAANGGSEEEAAAALKEAQRRIDRAVSKGTLHKNTAARRKARLAKRVKQLLG